MKAIIIGGDRHGETIDTLDGSTAWVDIRTASTHMIRMVTANVHDMKTGQITEAYSLYLAVHPDLTGPQEPQIVGTLVQALAMNAFAREHGDKQDIPHEPAGSELIVPGT